MTDMSFASVQDNGKRQPGAPATPRSYPAFKVVEAVMQRYFNVSPPSVHNMIVTLEKRQLIKRTSGASRSIQLLLNRAALPGLK
jgi:hypothetical protein